MNLTDKKYTQFELPKDMLETANVMRKFDTELGKEYADAFKAKKGIFYTGKK